LASGGMKDFLAMFKKKSIFVGRNQYF
jgi:hypothetical protein